jgi:hypothetical protein
MVNLLTFGNLCLGPVPEKKNVGRRRLLLIPEWLRLRQFLFLLRYRTDCIPEPCSCRPTCTGHIHDHVRIVHVHEHEHVPVHVNANGRAQGHRHRHGR